MEPNKICITNKYFTRVEHANVRLETIKIYLK